MTRGREPVACVIADTAHHRSPLAHETGDLPAGGFHQPLDGDAEALRGDRVDLLDLGAAKSR